MYLEKRSLRFSSDVLTPHAVLFKALLRHQKYQVRKKQSEKEKKSVINKLRI